MRNGEIRYIQIYTAAAIVMINEHVNNGEKYNEAKQAVIKQIMRGQACSGTVKKALYSSMQSICYEDLDKQTKSTLNDCFLMSVAMTRKRPIGWLERMFYKLTGSLF